jgi:hypothetical protein
MSLNSRIHEVCDSKLRVQAGVIEMNAVLVSWFPGFAGLPLRLNRFFAAERQAELSPL